MKNALWTLLGLFLITGAGLAQASILVLPDGTGDYPDIQTALYAAADGDTIELFNGVYTGAGNRNLEFVSDVVLKSRSGYTDCVIDCAGQGRAFSLTEETGGWIRGITVRNGLAAKGGVANSGWGTYVFQECLFLDNQATDKGGVWYGTDGGDVHFFDCVFSNNTSAGQGGCLMAEGATEVFIQRCSFVRNVADEGAGLYLGADAVGGIYNSIMAFNRGGAAFDGYYFSSLTIGCSNLYRNVGGDYVNGATGLGTDGNISEDPRWMDPMTELPDVRLTLNSPCRAAETDCSITMGAGSEISSSNPRYGINPEGTGMYASIYDAFASGSGLDYHAVVVLEDGVYMGAGDDEILLSGISLESRSGDPEACVIDYIGTADTTLLRVFLCPIPVHVKGITLSHSSHGTYPVLRVTSSESVLLEDCIFSNHYSTASSLGLFKVWDTDFMEFRNCRFLDNVGDHTQPMFDIDAPSSGLCSFNGCEFSGNQTGGILIQAENETLNMAATSIHDNTAAGILHSRNNILGWNGVAFASNTSNEAAMVLLEEADLHFNGSSVTDHTSSFPIFQTQRCTGYFEEIEFRDNWTDSYTAGGLTLSMSDMDVRNCLFAGNYSEGGAGALEVMFNDPSISLVVDMAITGCTFVGNESGRLAGALQVEANGLEDEFSGNSQHVNLNLESCTFEGNRMPYYYIPQVLLKSGVENYPFTPTGWIDWEMDQCLITNGVVGSGLAATIGTTGTTDIHCTNIHGNDAGDWDDTWLQAHFASLGNNSEDPLYCDAAAGDLTLQSTSPCLPLNNVCNLQIGAYGEGCSGASAVEDTPLAGRTGITGNYPNPFNPRTAISFNLAESGPVSVLVYDMSGRLVRTLVRDEVMTAGPQEVLWDGCDTQGRPAAAGIYLARLGAGEQTSTRKMIMIK